MLGVALLAAAALTTPTGAAPPPATATISVDGGTVEGRISPLLYGQFIEFMYEGIKRGLHAELIRNRSFEEGRGSRWPPRPLEPLPGRSQR